MLGLVADPLGDRPQGIGGLSRAAVSAGDATALWCGVSTGAPPTTARTRANSPSTEPVTAQARRDGVIRTTG